MNPPGPRKPKHLNGHRKASKQLAAPIENGLAVKRMRLNGKQELKIVNGNGKMKSNRKTKLKSNGIQNGNGYQTQLPANDSDDSMVQMDFKDVIPMNNVHQNGVMGNTISVCNGSPSLQKKVKFISADRFVHIKPPPINTEKIYNEKIYVTQQPNGDQSYNQLITVKHKESNDQTAAVSTVATYKSDEDTSELTSNTTDDTDAHMENINIFDIPILFADNDGNILENQSNNATKIDDMFNSTPYLEPLESSKTIEIISEEIITDPIIGKFVYLLNV